MNTTRMVHQQFWSTPFRIASAKVADHERRQPAKDILAEDVRVTLCTTAIAKRALSFDFNPAASATSRPIGLAIGGPDSSAISNGLFPSFEQTLDRNSHSRGS